MLDRLLKRYARLKGFRPEVFETITGQATDLKVYDRGHKTRFYHSGDFGDILYALPTVRALGGGVLVLGPEIKIGVNVATRQRFGFESFEALAPLLRLQPYLHAVEYSPEMPADIDIDLNQFRRYFMEEAALRRQGHRQLNLAEVHLKTFRQSLSACNSAWLIVDRVEKITDRPVLLHRSARWRNPEFPWAKVLEIHGHQAAFVGLRSEYDEFIAQWQVDLPYAPTDNFLELARVIAGSELYIGNQSAPYAVAEGLKKNTLQEVWPEGPNCLFERDAAHYGDGRQVFIPKLAKTMTKEKISCPICASDRAEPVRTRADIVQCQDCQLVYLRTRPSKESMEERYQTYAEGGSHMRLPVAIEELRTSGLRREYFMQELLEFAPVGRPGAPRNFLDVGCGWGAFLANARDKGYQPFGVEICAKLANFASGTLGLPVQAKQIEDCLFNATFEVVTLVHALNHLSWPARALATAHALLQPRGVLCGIVPNYASLCSQALRDKWPWLDPETHQVYFTPESLTRALEKSGFKLLRLYTHTGDFDVATVVAQVQGESNLPLAPDELADRIEKHGQAGRGEEIRFFAERV